jgi:stress-induced morphogen
MQAFIRSALTTRFEPVHLEVLNESHGGQHLESHFKVVIATNEFHGKPLLQQHRLVKAALTDGNGNLPFHSLSVVPFTAEKWLASRQSVPASPKCAGGDGLKQRP